MIRLALLLATALAQSPSAPLLAPAGTLRASFIASNPVQGRVDPATGTPTGPAPDLARELARRTGVAARVLPLPDANAVMESVKNGTVDIGFLALESARATQVDFSDAYTTSGAAYAVRADAPFRASADVDRAGVTIGIIAGQSPGVYVREHVTRAQVHTMPDVPPNGELGRLLLEGTIQAVAANRTRMEELVREVPGLRVLDDDYMVTSQAVVVRKGETAKLGAINRFLAEVRRSGFVQASLDRARVAGVRVAPEPAR